MPEMHVVGVGPGAAMIIGDERIVAGLGGHGRGAARAADLR